MDSTQGNVPAHRLYRYLGPPEILRRAHGSGGGTRVLYVSDLYGWITATHQHSNTASLVTATFVIDAEGYLLVADRHSEHVVCAGGGYVRAAGEIFFRPCPAGWMVEQISNQSTGYCPEPESWPDVAAALDAIPLAHPDQFTFACVFRRCLRCNQLNIVKDGVFECDVCGADLPSVWNADASAASSPIDPPS